jgi:hypothetical protein
MGHSLEPCLALLALLLAVACAPSAAPRPATGPDVLVAPGSPEPEPTAQGADEHAAPVARDQSVVAHLTGGVGNKVVGSFDQLRAAVRPLQRTIDDCYQSTAPEGGWRENLMWDLDISAEGTVTRATPHDAEYWRGGKVVPATPSIALAACMDRALRRLVIAPPVQAGWVRLRFEL